MAEQLAIIARKRLARNHLPTQWWLYRVRTHCVQPSEPQRRKKSGTVVSSITEILETKRVTDAERASWRRAVDQQDELTQEIQTFNRHLLDCGEHEESSTKA